MRRDISSGLGQGSCDAGVSEERCGEIRLSNLDGISGKGSYWRGVERM